MRKVQLHRVNGFSRTQRIYFLAVASITLIGCSFAEFVSAELTPAQLEFFESRIRPVLVEHCYECHNSADTAEGELTVDFRQGLLDGGANGVIVVPGQPDKSQLLPILRHEIPDMEMPEDGPKLSAEVIADFEKWIAMGAPDPRDEPPSAEELSAATSWESQLERRKQWWSLQPIQEPEIPSPPGADSSTHPVDRFVLQKLAEKGLEPGEPADAHVLLRRLYFNLIGLPPSGEDIDRWVVQLEQAKGAKRQAVVGELVDELLASPQFGERWARHWMDWIRYAESHGSERDPAINNAWMYRDYLIRALNADVPYDQLVREHVAGDLLAEPRVNEQLGINESIIGPAHWRMVFHGFSPTDALEERVRFTDDQIDVFSKAFLGLTVSCARCHDHKFDAISQKDYYALFGILASCRPARVSVELPERLLEHEEALSALKPQIREAIASDWLASAANLAERISAAKESKSLLRTLIEIKTAIGQGTSFETAWQEQLKKWQSSRHAHEKNSANKYALSWDFTKQQDYENWFAVGTGLPDNPQATGCFSIATEGDTALTGIYPAGVYSHGLTEKSSASLNSAYFQAEQGSELWLQVIGDGDSSVRYVVQDYPRSGTIYPISRLKNQWKWQRFDISYWKGDRVHIELVTAQDAPLLVEPETRSWFGIRQAIVRRQGEPAPSEIDEYLLPIFSIAATQPPQTLAELVEIYQSAITAAVEAWRVDNLSDAQSLLLDACLREGLLANQRATLPTAKPLLDKYRRLEAKVVVPTRVHGLAETVGRNQHLFDRGNHKNPKEEVPRRFLEAIDATPYQTSQSGRLQLADDLLREDNPLTRRVIVNRVWHHLLGRGIVATPDNLGRLGAMPTHQELLDWLATEFENEGWSLKKLIRLIVMSDTWQRSAQPPAKAEELDPDNQLLAHAHVRRLEAEAVRDSLLTASGLLDGKQFGESVAGKQPRRGIYVRVIRNSLDPLLRVFDFPEPFTTTGRRDATNVPAQSLTLMNDAGVIGYATSWAKQVLDAQELGSDEQRIQRMFTTAFGRPAKKTEIAEVQAYLADALKRYQRINQQLAELKQQQRDNLASVEKLLAPVRQRLVDAKPQVGRPSLDTAPKPVGRWELKGELSDSVGKLNLELKNGAKVTDEGLIVKNNAYAISVPLAQDIREKTLEAWVLLDNLEQRGGGVLSLQTTDGVYFDAIVFGEKDPRQWLAGSNGFARTQSFQADAETEAVERPIHFAITYHPDGRITGYREGLPYGKPYLSKGPYQFQAGNAVLTLGLRHLPSVGNRGLAGKIVKARLYDRALSAEEIAASYDAASDIITDTQVIAALSDEDRSRYNQLQAEADELDSRITALGVHPELPAETAAWTDLARAMFMMKEFIYVR